MYGGGAAKLADTLGKPKTQGNKLRKAFWDGNPALKALKKEVDKTLDARGFLVGYDGRKLVIRSGHKALNSLFQSMAAIVFKTWLVAIYDWVKVNPIKANQMIAYHDEGQYEVEPMYAGPLAYTMENLAIEVGKRLNIKTPIEAASKMGYTWADTH